MKLIYLFFFLFAVQIAAIAASGGVNFPDNTTQTTAGQAASTALTHYSGTDTNAILAAIGGAALTSPALTGTPTINGQSIETQLTNRVLRAGDTMSGTLAVTGFTNTARTASRFVVAAADKSDATSAASSVLLNTLTDPTGTGVAVFGTSPTITTKFTITGATETSSNPPLDIAQTWNSSGVTFTGPKINITDTASTTGSLLFDVQRSTATFFNVMNGNNPTSGSGQTTGGVRIPVGSNRRMLYGFGANATGISAQGNSRLGVVVGNTDYAEFSSSLLNLGSGISLAWSSTTDPEGTVDVVIGRDSAATVQLGVDAATPVAQTIKAADGSGTDKAGANLTIEGGQSTGTAASGAAEIATALSAEASGSTANTYSIRYHAKGKFVALTHDTATTIETFSLAANKIRGGEIVVTTYATNSTPHLQCRTTSLVFQAVAVSTTITGTIDVVKAGTLAADSGTLTETYSLLDNGNNTFSIQLRANSDLSSPTERCKVVIPGMSGNAAVTITDP